MIFSWVCLREQKTAATDCQLLTRCERFDKMLRTNRGSGNSMRGLSASSPLVWALVSEKIELQPQAKTLDLHYFSSSMSTIPQKGN